MLFLVISVATRLLSSIIMYCWFTSFFISQWGFWLYCWVPHLKTYFSVQLSTALCWPLWKQHNLILFYTCPMVSIVFRCPKDGWLRHLLAKLPSSLWHELEQWYHLHVMFCHYFIGFILLSVLDNYSFSKYIRYLFMQTNCTSMWCNHCTCPWYLWSPLLIMLFIDF